MNKAFDWTWMKGYAPWVIDHVDEIKALPYAREKFNNDEQFRAWELIGFTPRTGALFDMRHTNQPTLTQKLIAFALKEGLENVGVSYYRMDRGDNLPYHKDTYKKYIELFDLKQRRKNIVRFVFFPEIRMNGHILEIDGKLIDWKAGDWIAWRYDTPHMAANLGTESRYTIQVTGVMREDFE
jgi:hypothetical protein